MLHRYSKVIEKQKVGQGRDTYKQVLISSNEAPNFAMRKFIIEPGGSMPLHTNLIEHEQYVLNGNAQLNIGKKQINVSKDDVIFIPGGAEHDYKNTGSEPFEFLCVVPNKEDKIELL